MVSNQKNSTVLSFFLLFFFQHKLDFFSAYKFICYRWKAGILLQGAWNTSSTSWWVSLLGVLSDFFPLIYLFYLLMLTYNKQFIWEYSINLQCFSWFPPLCAWGFRWQLCRWFKRTRSSRIRSIIWGLTVKRKTSEPFFILSFETFCSCYVLNSWLS